MKSKLHNSSVLVAPKQAASPSIVLPIWICGFVAIDLLGKMNVSGSDSLNREWGVLVLLVLNQALVALWEILPLIPPDSQLKET